MLNELTKYTQTCHSSQSIERVYPLTTQSSIFEFTVRERSIWKQRMATNNDEAFDEQKSDSFDFRQKTNAHIHTDAETKKHGRGVKDEWIWNRNTEYACGDEFRAKKKMEKIGAKQAAIGTKPQSEISMKRSIQHTCYNHNVEIFKPTASLYSTQSICCSIYSQNSRHSTTTNNEKKEKKIEKCSPLSSRGDLLFSLVLF